MQLGNWQLTKDGLAMCTRPFASASYYTKDSLRMAIQNVKKNRSFYQTYTAYEAALFNFQLGLSLFTQQQQMTINLSKFLNTEVRITLRNGEVLTGIIRARTNGNVYPFIMEVLWGTETWTSEGKYVYFYEHPMDIVMIVKTQPKQQLLQSIKDTEEQLARLKEQLKRAPTIQDAEVGDTLEDGSIVLKKENGLALLIAPKSTEVNCMWSKEFSRVFDKLTEEGFIKSQWFVPTVEQLKLAFKVIPDELNNEYWSSCDKNAFRASCVVYDNQYNLVKENTFSVRAFRCISY
jgi:hypothetical protein